MARPALQNVGLKLKPTRMVPAFLLRGFWDELEKRSLPLSELERLSGVARPRVSDCLTMIPAADMHRLFDVCQKLSGDESIGLTAGRAIGASGFHLVGHLVLASRTLAEAIDLVMRVQPHIRERSPTLEELDDGRVRVGIGVHDDPRPGARVEAELTAVLLHDVVVHFLPDAAREAPVVEFPFPAPHDTSLHRRMFPGGVRFDCEGTFVSFRGSALRRRSGADSGLLEHLLNLALDQYAATNTEGNWTSRVRGALRAHSAPRLIDASKLADHFGVSVRVLARRLAREGTSFSDLLDETLFERAQTLLRRPGSTSAQVADALGYAELSSFFRAFRRWSGGLTPNAYRSADR